MRIAFPFLFLSLGCKDPLVVKEYVALVSVSPSHGATQVAVNTDIIAGFSEALVPASIDAQSAYLEDEGGLPIVAEVTYNDTSHWIVIDPESDLNPSTTYTVTFTSSIRGKDSGRLLAPLQSTFTTAGNNPSNDLPVANAGPDQTVSLGDTVQLSGSASADPEGAALSFQWQIVSTPASSAVNLSDTTVAQPRFTPDIQGEYIVGLTVNDGIQDSSQDFAVISVLGISEGSNDTGLALDSGTADVGTDTGLDDEGADTLTGPADSGSTDATNTDSGEPGGTE